MQSSHHIAWPVGLIITDNNVENLVVLDLIKNRKPTHPLNCNIENANTQKNSLQNS